MVEMTNDILDEDTYLLCSDGLSDMISDEQIKKLLANGADADALCEEAIAYGGYDNVSACVIRVKK
jgi:protein phosphatase